MLLEHASPTGSLDSNWPRLFETLPAGLDLRDAAQHESVLAIADALIARAGGAAQLLEMEWTLAGNAGEWPLGAHLAVKLARSKLALSARRGPVHLSVVLAVYAEHQRILDAGERPHGEAFLDRKLRELAWLFAGGRNGTYELLVVDDGCPHGSGRIAEQILRTRHPAAPARVLFLEHAIARGDPAVAHLSSTDESRKGGAIRYGLHAATRRLRPGHVALYTDADLSTHLGQSGLLVAALDRPGVMVAAGSRRARNSVVIKSGARSDRGRLFIHLWKRLLPELAYVEDTQCGFKAFTGCAVRALIDSPVESGFAFDLELLLRAELLAHRSVDGVPIAWIDSEAASTTVSLQPYLAMLKSVVQLYRAYREREPEREGVARAIEAFDERAWQRAVADLAPRVAAGGGLRLEALQALAA